MTITEKVAYIKGLAEGMKIDDSTNEGKITLAMLDVLNDIGLTLEDFDSDLDDMDEALSDVEESVYELEDAVFGDDDDDCDCDDCEDDLYEVECPTCHNSITADFDVISSGSIACPNCGETLEFDLEGLEECDCGCNHN